MPARVEPTGASSKKTNCTAFAPAIVATGYDSHESKIAGLNGTELWICWSNPAIGKRRGWIFF